MRKFSSLLFAKGVEQDVHELNALLYSKDSPGHKISQHHLPICLAIELSVRRQPQCISSKDAFYGTGPTVHSSDCSKLNT